jgi:hypothetical protein
MMTRTIPYPVNAQPGKPFEKQKGQEGQEGAKSFYSLLPLLALLALKLPSQFNYPSPVNCPWMMNDER